MTIIDTNCPLAVQMWQEHAVRFALGFECVVPDLNIFQLHVDDQLARIAHRCGCHAWWWRCNDDVWRTSDNSPWVVCPDHRDALRDVPRPDNGYPWTR